MPNGMAQSNGEYHYDKMMFRVPVNSFIVGSLVEWFGIIISWPTIGACEVWEKKIKAFAHAKPFTCGAPSPGLDS